MGTKTISGKLVFLKPLNSQETKQVKIWDKDPDVSRYREIWDFKEAKSKSIDLAIYEKVSKKLIGSISVSSIDIKNKHAEIGMAIGDKNYWRKGYGTDTVKVILSHCFLTLGMNKVYLDVWEDNKGAIGCYLKCGFKKDGVLREDVFNNGIYYDKWIMSVLKKEWKEQN